MTTSSSSSSMVIITSLLGATGVLQDSIEGLLLSVATEAVLVSSSEAGENRSWLDVALGVAGCAEGVDSGDVCRLYGLGEAMVDCVAIDDKSGGEIAFSTVSEVDDVHGDSV